MRVLKFGGTSIGDVQSIGRVIEIVKSEAGNDPLLVLSAMGETTDRLVQIGECAASGGLNEALDIAADLSFYHMKMIEALEMSAGQRGDVTAYCEELCGGIRELANGLAVVRDLSPAVLDRLLASGELLSTQIMCAAISSAGLPAAWVDAREIIVTGEEHGGAEPDAEATNRLSAQRLSPLIEAGKMVVTQGFIGRSASGATTNLGRGGSDYTASLLGAALGAAEVQIWTDVDGIMTADPSLVPEARNIPVMSFREAAELAFFGARVLHPRTLLPAVEKNIPVRVLNTRRPMGAGTLILAEIYVGGPPVKSVAYKEGMTLVTLVSARMFKAHGYLARVFAALDRLRLAPDLVATSEVSIAIALWDSSGLDELVREIRSFGPVTVRKRQAVVCVVGERIKSTPGIASRVFEDLRDVRTSLISLGGSEINLSFVVDESDLPLVVGRLHQRFFESNQIEEDAR